MDNASERFLISSTAPRNFELKSQLNRETKKQERIKHYIENLQTTDMEEQALNKQIFLMTDEKVRLQSLKQFLKTYVRYVNKLLLTQDDPFLQNQHRKYLRMIDFNKLSKVSNVFERLSLNSQLGFLAEIKKDKQLASLVATKNETMQRWLKKSYIANNQHDLEHSSEDSEVSVLDETSHRDITVEKIDS